MKVVHVKHDILTFKPYVSICLKSELVTTIILLLALGMTPNIIAIDTYKISV